DLTPTEVGLSSSDGPVVLTTTPGAAEALDRSPLVIRLSLSAPLNPSTVLSGKTVRLTLNPTGTFGDGSDQAVKLAKVYYSAAANEIQLSPAAALAPGFYQVWLAGDSSVSSAVVRGSGGAALGQSASTPLGLDFTFTFEVTGVEGVP